MAVQIPPETKTIDYDVNVFTQEHPESKTIDVIVKALDKTYVATIAQRDYEYVTKGFIGRAIFNILRNELNLSKKASIEIVQQKNYTLNQRGHPRCRGKNDEEQKEKDRRNCRKYYYAHKEQLLKKSKIRYRKNKEVSPIMA